MGIIELDNGYYIELIEDGKCKDDRIQNIQTIFPEALGFRDFYLSTRSGTHFPIYRSSLINSIILTEIKII